jgi:uncharacterized protein (TIGR02246 family)
MTIDRLAHESATAAIGRVRQAFERALRSGDSAAAAAVYADDATLLAPAADVVRGRAAIERFRRTGLESGITGVDLSVLDFRRQGDVAVEVGEYELVLASETGTSVVDQGHYLVVHRAEPDGSWRRTAEMFSPSRLPAEVA